VLRRVRSALLAGRRRLGRGIAPAAAPPVPEAPALPETSVVLCFRDGSAAALDPAGPHAAALLTLAARLRER
jgi:hypothetical protein